MENHLKIIEEIEKVETWKNSEEFLIDALLVSSSKLFIKCYKDIEENSFVTMTPLLRQIQENIIAVLGLGDGKLTTTKFIKKKYNANEIMKSIKKNNPEIDENDFDATNKYLKDIKEVLNKFSHTSFEGVLTLFTERFQVHESIMFNKVMMKFFLTLLERPFIAICNSVHNLNIDIPNMIDLKDEMKNVGTLKYVTRKFPESIKDFINNSPELNEYYKDTVSDLKKLFDLTKLNKMSK